MKITQTLVIAFSFLLLLSCNKETNWSTEIIYSTDIELTSAMVTADFSLPNNKNDVYLGICWSKDTMPTIENKIHQMKILESDFYPFFIDELSPITTYYVRSYIIKSNGEVIYSSQFSFTTAGSPIAPCETESGVINYFGTDYSMDDLSEYPFGNYTLETSSVFGELTFEFYERPTKIGMFKTVKTHFDLNKNTVIVEGLLGSCFHGTKKDIYVYVNILEDDKISISFCELIMTPGGTCTGNKELTGEVHE